MPNWCVGDLKVRGEKENIKRFLLEALVPQQPVSPMIAQMLGKTVEPVNNIVKEDEWSLTLRSTGDGFYVKGTHRNFIDNSVIEWEFDRKVLIIEDYRAAWGIDSTPLVELSKEYDLDLKIYAFEKGMEFNQDIEIHKGTIIKDIEVKFDDYDWECLSPTVGG